MPFVNLVRNENMKIYRRVRTWVMAGLIVLITLGYAYLIYVTSTYNNNSSMTMWKLMQHLTAMTGLVTMFTVVIAADIVAGEFSWGTIKLLLIRPASRSKILLSKYAATLIYALLMTALLFVTTFVAGGLFFGFGGNATLEVLDSQGYPQAAGAMGVILKDYGYRLIDVLMIVTFAFMMSSVFRSGVLAIVLSFLILFFGNIVTGIVSQYAWAKYILFANMGLGDIAQGHSFVEGVTLPFAVTMLAIYFVLFNALSWIVFNKRDVAA